MAIEFSERRYPYTYGHDYVRTIIADETGHHLSRGAVARINKIYANAAGVTPELLAKFFADRYLKEHNISRPFDEEVLKKKDARIKELQGALTDLLSWFPDNPSSPEWRLKGGHQGADDAVEYARRVAIQETDP